MSIMKITHSRLLTDPCFVARLVSSEDIDEQLVDSTVLFLLEDSLLVMTGGESNMSIG